LAVVAGVSDVPSAEELSALPAVELAARLAEAYRLIGELTAQNERLADRGWAAGAQRREGLIHVVAADIIGQPV
jgi:hypothetical protein